MYCRIRGWGCRPPSVSFETHCNVKWRPNGRWRQWKFFIPQNLHVEIVFVFPLETAFKTHQPEVPGTGIAACPDTLHAQKRAKTSALLNFSTSAHSSKPCSLAQHQQDLPSLGWCKQPWQSASVPTCSRSCLPYKPAPGWGWTDRRMDEWTQKTGKREFRTSVFTYRWEFWPSSGKWVTNRDLISTNYAVSSFCSHLGCCSFLVCPGNRSSFLQLLI